MNDPALNATQVAVVVTDAFASRIMDLSREGPVWAVRTPATEAPAQAIWAERSEGSVDRLTLFRGGSDPEESFCNVLPEIELHHGLAAHHEPAMIKLVVLGVEATVRVRKALAEVGFPNVDPTEQGFVARWASTDA